MQRTLAIFIVLSTTGEVAARGGIPKSHQLSAVGATHQVVGHAIAADDDWLVYTAGPLGPGTSRLYAVHRALGAVPTELSPAGSIVLDTLAVVGRRVVFVTQSPESALWSAAVDGGPGSAIKISPSNLEGVSGFEVSPDGARVVFAGVVSGVNEAQLWAVPTAGPATQAVRLSPVAPAGAIGVIDFEVTPNSELVVMIGDLDDDLVFEAWSVPISGPNGSAIKLHEDLGDSRDVSSFLIDPSSTRALLVGDFVVDGQPRLRSAPLLGPAGTDIGLDPTPPAGGGLAGSYAIAPDGVTVVFVGDYLVDGRREIYSVPLLGPAAFATRLNPLAAAGQTGVSNHQGAFAIAPDSSHVAFAGAFDASGKIEVLATPIDGPHTLSIYLNPVPPGAQTTAARPVFSPDSSRVAFRGAYTTTGVDELFVADPASGHRNGFAVSGTIASGGGVDDFAFTPVGDRLVFFGDLNFADRFWLYSVPIAGGPRTTLTNLLLAPDADVATGDWKISPGGSWVYYRADSAVDGRFDLRRVPAAGGAGSLLSPGLSDNDDVESFRIADDAGVVYVVHRGDGSEELWISDEWIFGSGFEEGDMSVWSSATP